MGFLSGIFGGGSNPADKAMPYLEKIPGEVKPYFDPYINAGNRALPTLEEQYGMLLGNPGNKLNQIGESFQSSPGFQFALQQALQGAGHAAAAGGMAGSPQHEQQNMQLANDLANQDYYNWLGQATGLYGQGLSGEQGLASGGLQAGTTLADILAKNRAQQGDLAFRGQQEKNANRNSLLGGLGKLGGAALGAFGMPRFGAWNNPDNGRREYY